MPPVGVFTDCRINLTVSCWLWIVFMHVKDIRETPELLTTELFSLSSPIVYFLKVVFMVGIELIYNW